MKIRRIVPFILIVFLYLFTPVFSLQWIFLLVIFMTAASFVWSITVYRSIRVERRDTCTRTYRRENAEIEIIVTNRSFLPVHYISVIDSTGNLFTDGKDRSVLNLRPFERTVVSYAAQGDARGEYILGPVKIRYSDPAGLFSWMKEINECQSLIVYPNVYPVRFLIAEGLPSGTIRTTNPIYEDITRFRSLREYVPGDEMKRIQWKISARTGKLHSMEYLPSLYFPTLVLLNISAEDYAPRHRFRATERAIETAASLVFAAIAVKQEVGFVSSGMVGEDEHPIANIRGGHMNAVSILESLARIRMSGRGSDIAVIFFSSGIHVPPGSRIMYVGPMPGEEQLSHLLSVRSRGVELELYLPERSERTQNRSELKNVRIYTIREYGDELVEPV